MHAIDSIDLSEDPCAIVATRIIAAPRDLVFTAWTDVAHLSRWWGPDGFTTTTHTFDFKVGGGWRFVMHGPDGRNYENHITYEEIEPPERLLYTHGGGDDVEPVRFRVAVVFEDLGGSTRLTVRSMFPTAAARARVIADYGADKGLAQTLARLTVYVTGLARS